MLTDPEEQRRYNAVDFAVRAGSSAGRVVTDAQMIEQYLRDGAVQAGAQADFLTVTPMPETLKSQFISAQSKNWMGQ